MSVEDLLARARERLRRVGPEEAAREVSAGAVLVDIRTEHLIARDGVVPGARYIPRNVLEWRCDPDSSWRDPDMSDPERRVIVMCDEGYASSLAAVVLQDLGLPEATDLDGGFQAWKAAGLPVEPAAQTCPTPRATPAID